MASSPVQPGDLIAGKYRVERVLGAGGMGVVVAAMHVDLEQRVAIKLLLAKTPEQAERLLREARAAVRLRSEHAAKVLDVGRLDDATPFLVLEYLEGRDFDQILQTEGPLHPRRVARYLVQACEAIAEAHALGIVHRDLKPQNLFLLKGLAGEDIVKVLDFGIAKTAGFREEQSLTGEQSLMGSPVYMPPEQMRSARNVLPQGDIWALGVTLQELLTGRTPFDGDSLAELCLNVVGAEPRSPLLDRPDLPAEMVGIIARCLARDPAQRYAHAGELATALESLAPPESSFSANRARLLTGMRSVAFEATLEAQTPESVRPFFQSSGTLEPMLASSRQPTPASLRPFASSPSLGHLPLPEPSASSSIPAATVPSPSTGGGPGGRLAFAAAAAMALVFAAWLALRDSRTPAHEAAAREGDSGVSAAGGPLVSAVAIGDAAVVLRETPAPTTSAAPHVTSALPAAPSAAANPTTRKTSRPAPRRAPPLAGDGIPSMR